MKIIKVKPIEVKSFISNCDNVYKNSILVGKCHEDNYYLSDLTFPSILTSDNEVLTKAVLKMYCKKNCGSQDYINICINNDNLCLDVSRVGNYEWDVTNIVKDFNKCNLKLCVYTKDWISYCGIKEFEALDYSTGPVLELIVDDVLPNPDNKIIDNVKEYISTSFLKHSEWIDCIYLNSYYYFIKNLGNSEVEVFVEISPDKKLIFQDSGPFKIKANEILYIQPMRESRFVRISYRNSFSNYSNLIKVWLQGKNVKK